ncbi:MAG: serine hydrolase domain-containing protein [Pseudomonadota bacterium]
MTTHANPESLGLSTPRLTRISDWLQAQVDAERLAGASVLIGRRGQVAYSAHAGVRALTEPTPFDLDTVVRIFSMTKPITSVAAMMCYERGCFQLDDPVARFLPAFSDMRVWQGGDLTNTAPAQTPITIKHLFTHTAGLTYGFMRSNPVDRAYRQQDIEFPGDGGSLAEMVDTLAALPLICEPGSAWNYSVATDVLGRLVELWSGQPLDQCLKEWIFDPLGMHDTSFTATDRQHSRLAACYVPASGGGMADVAATPRAAAVTRGGLKLQESAADSRFLKPTRRFSGGGGLLSTAGDFARFCQCLLNEGTLDGQMLLSPTTVRYMRTNQLPGGGDMASMGQPVWSETSYDGIGFGLGFAVVLDPVKANIITHPGEHHWGGAASTFFWIDPEADLYAVFLTQLVPSSTYPIRRELRARVYQALLD